MHRRLQGNVAQWLEPLPFKQHYVGSNPTILKNKISFKPENDLIVFLFSCFLVFLFSCFLVFFKSLKEVYIKKTFR